MSAFKYHIMRIWIGDEEPDEFKHAYGLEDAKNIAQDLLAPWCSEGQGDKVTFHHCSKDQWNVLIDGDEPSDVYCAIIIKEIK